MRWWPPWRTPPDAPSRPAGALARSPRIRRADVLLAAGLAAFTAACYLGGVFERLEIIAIDVRYQWFSAPARPDIVLVLIDSDSLKRVGPWPWRRSVHARLLRRVSAAGARAVGYDVEFGTPRDPESDAQLAGAVAEGRAIVLAVFHEYQRLPEGGAVYRATPLMPELRRAGAVAGSISFPIDAGGGVRRAPLAEDVGGDPHWAFGVEVVRLAEGLPPDRVRWAGSGRLLLGSHTIRGDRHGLVYIDYAGGRGTFPGVPASDVLDGRVPDEVIRGRVVLVGASAIDLQDLHSSPFPGVMPGVEIQANLVSGLLRGVAARRLPPWITLAVLAVLAAGWPAVAGRAVRRSTRVLVKTVRLALTTGAIAAGLLAAGGILFWAWRLFLDVVPLMAGAVAMGAVAVVAEGVRTGRRATASAVALAPASGGPPGAAAVLEQAVDILFMGLRDFMGVEALVVELRRGMRRPGVSRMVRAARDIRVGEDLPACRDAVHRALAERAPALLARLGPAFAPAADAPGLHAAGSAFVPLVVGGKAIGVLHAHRRSAPFEADDLRVMVALGAQLALTAQNQDLMQDLQALYLGTMATLADAVEARDAYTGGHCKRVSDLSVRLAQAAGLPASEVEEVRIGALVHDIGKIGIADQILGKPGRLTPEEMEHVRRHTVIGERIIAQLPVSQTVRDVILSHHERYNGSGYPRGLRGDTIPMSARIVAIADAFEAMTSGRIYRPPISLDQALFELRRASGTHLDPYLIELFLHLLETEGIAPPPEPPARAGADPPLPTPDIALPDVPPPPPDA